MQTELVNAVSKSVSDSIGKILNGNDIKELSVRIAELNQKISNLPCKDHTEKIDTLRISSAKSSGSLSMVYKFVAFINSLVIIILMVLKFF